MDTLERINADLKLSIKATFIRLDAWRKTFLTSVPGDIRQDEYGELALAVYNNIIEGNVDRAIALLYKFKEPAERIAKVEEEFEIIRRFRMRHAELSCRRLEKRDGKPKGSYQSTSWAADADSVRLSLYEKEFGKVEAAKILKIKPINNNRPSETPKQERNNRATKSNHYRS